MKTSLPTLAALLLSATIFSHTNAQEVPGKESAESARAALLKANAAEGGKAKSFDVQTQELEKLLKARQAIGQALKLAENPEVKPEEFSTKIKDLLGPATDEDRKKAALFEYLGKRPMAGGDWMQGDWVAGGGGFLWPTKPGNPGGSTASKGDYVPRPLATSFATLEQVQALWDLNKALAEAVGKLAKQIDRLEKRLPEPAKPAASPAPAAPPK